MKVLVTGGAGYLGSVLAGYLLGQGHQVRVLDSLMYGGASLLGLFPQQGFEFARGDVRDSMASERAVFGMDVVVHLAAIVGDPACIRQPDLARDVNQEAAIKLYELCRCQGIKRFVFASTCSNYGRVKDSNDYVNEESELRPVSLYAETKVAVERALLENGSDQGCDVTVLRFATLFGLSPRPRFDLTINEFTMELATRESLLVYGEQFWRPYLHVRDAARAIGVVLASHRNVVAGQVFNIGDTSQNYRKQQIVEMVCSHLNRPLDIKYVHKEEDPRDYRVSFEKFHAALGFNITRKVVDGIREIDHAIQQRVFTDFSNPAYRN